MKTAKELLEEFKVPEDLYSYKGLPLVGDSTVTSLLEILASLEERLAYLEGKKFCTCPPGPLEFDGESQ